MRILLESSLFFPNTLFVVGLAWWTVDRVCTPMCLNRLWCNERDGAALPACRLRSYVETGLNQLMRALPYPDEKISPLGFLVITRDHGH